jgi:hypothetical protein
MLVRSQAAYRGLLAALLLLIVLSCVVALAFGPAAVPLGSVWGILGRQLGVDLPGQWSAGQEHIVWSIRAPRVLLGALVGALLARFMGLSLGGTAMLATLAASASYIAVPAAMRLALPEANPSLSLTASLGITFPFNILIGIPLYLALAEQLIAWGL